MFKKNKIIDILLYFLNGGYVLVLQNLENRNDGININQTILMKIKRKRFYLCTVTV